MAGAAPSTVEEFMDSQEQLSMLRFITCGSVDDGKSTLIGRLLYDTKRVFDDHLAALEADSKVVGTQGGDLDFALLVDGLAAEREQGITIDVAYRFFATERRKFIVADTPGHEQYTRNMVTGASTAELAVILVDARQGVLVQTRRHTYIASLLGIGKIVLAVNKLDLCQYSESVFTSIVEDYRSFAGQLGVTDVTAIPVSALLGDNVSAPSANTPWYDGPTLVEHLETVEIDEDIAQRPFRMPVQWVNRPDPHFRGFSGQVTGGAVHVGDQVRVLPGGQQSTVARIVTADGDLDEAAERQSVTLVLTDEIDVSRGDVLADASEPPGVADQFQSHLVWMNEQPMLPGRPYLLKLGTITVGATVAHPKYKVNVNTLEHVAATTLELNEIGVCNLHLDRPVAFDPYTANREMGGFILIDRFDNGTVGAGLIDFELRRSANIHWQALEVDKTARSGIKAQRPALIWLTGLSGAGKSTIANVLERKLHELGRHTYLLDGDNVRHGLSMDLGFTDADRVENIRRVSETAGLMVDAGLIVITSFISPFRAERAMARARVDEGEFIEVFVDTPLEVAEERDPKGLYQKARSGELTNFTGIDSPYEAPTEPDIHVKTTHMSPEEAADAIIEYLMSPRL